MKKFDWKSFHESFRHVLFQIIFLLYFVVSQLMNNPVDLKWFCTKQKFNKHSIAMSSRELSFSAVKTEEKNKFSFSEIFIFIKISILLMIFGKCFTLTFSSTVCGLIQYFMLHETFKLL